MSMYSDYVKEREDFETIETWQGFATYKITGKECYIRDIYVTKDFRKSAVASEMADQIAVIAKKQDCTQLLGSVSLAANGANASIKVLLAYGFELQSAQNGFLVFKKEI